VKETEEVGNNFPEMGFAAKHEQMWRVHVTGMGFRRVQIPVPVPVPVVKTRAKPAGIPVPVIFTIYGYRDRPLDLEIYRHRDRSWTMGLSHILVLTTTTIL